MAVVSVLDGLFTHRLQAAVQATGHPVPGTPWSQPVTAHSRGAPCQVPRRARSLLLLPVALPRDAWRGVAVLDGVVAVAVVRVQPAGVYTVLDVPVEPESAAPASSATRHAFSAQAAARSALRPPVDDCPHCQACRRARQVHNHWLPRRVHVLPQTRDACQALPLLPNAQQRTLQELAGVLERRQPARLQP